MKETASSKPSSSSSHSSRGSDEEDYQVDNLSTSSCRDSEDEADNSTIVVSNETALPTIESVSVVNSNDVHIGNKTVYQGPVTIKQIVYPNGAISSDSVDSLEQCENKVSVKLNGFSATDGLDNPCFVKEPTLGNKDNADKDAQNNNAQQTTTECGKGLLWLQKFKKLTYVVIFLSALVVAIVILIAVKYWTPLPPHVIADGDSNEQERNTPWTYLTDSNSTINERVRIVPRQQWLAQPPVEEAHPLKTPVPLVIIQHTATESCSSMAQCIYHVRQIQSYHIESNQWWDIGYNFLVGGDGAAYEGRGWTHEGAHTYGYNYRSIGVGFIGTFNNEVPPKNQIAAFHKLLAKGVDLGYLKKDYKILAARQLYGTESPGAAFYKEIVTWRHWSKDPNNNDS